MDVSSHITYSIHLLVSSYVFFHGVVVTKSSCKSNTVHSNTVGSNFGSTNDGCGGTCSDMMWRSVTFKYTCALMLTSAGRRVCSAAS